MKMPNLGDQVVLSNKPDATVYTVSEVYSSSGVVWAKLTYVNDGGRVVEAGGVDASLLLPSPNCFDTIGVDVARKCSWDGTAIVAVMMAALTDANFHSLRSRFEDAFNNYIEDVGQL
jgi:hypothetical protein